MIWYIFWVKFTEGLGELKLTVSLLYIYDSLRMMVLKVKIVQEYKNFKVKMYKPIWGLVFKCNDSEIQFNLIQFS
jgi:hypothetical protein